MTSRAQDIGTLEQIAGAIRVLGVTPRDVLSIKAAPTWKEARGRLRLLKHKAKNRFRKAVTRLHPDVTGNNLRKAELLMVLKAINDEIQLADLRSV